jgi:hypothetical protein
MCSTEQHDSVAQLGERHLDRVEVAGSSPVGIIIRQKTASDQRLMRFFLFVDLTLTVLQGSGCPSCTVAVLYKRNVKRFSFRNYEIGGVFYYVNFKKNGSIRRGKRIKTVRSTANKVDASLEILFERFYSAKVAEGRVKRTLEQYKANFSSFLS